ncbi:hypothetical protein Lfu02_14970 [Longispora fulva]|uniref:Uncharacterized protein n=1 Tax=Longispora fulva TaxID=619741 RepID=A0A8J7GGX7_9ACTN|nr:hypothetical protein [Longispora fulva]GIG57125.1 hypothetical protein Lfu02_14970 [Longispora fulva]
MYVQVFDSLVDVPVQLTRIDGRSSFVSVPPSPCPECRVILACEDARVEWERHGTELRAIWICTCGARLPEVYGQ